MTSCCFLSALNVNLVIWDVLTAPNAAHTPQGDLSVMVEEGNEKEKERQEGRGETGTGEQTATRGATGTQLRSLGMGGHVRLQ